MKRILLFLALAVLSFGSAMALEPLKVAFTHSGTTPVSVTIKLTDYSSGTGNVLYTQAPASYTPNSSGVIIAQVSGSTWGTITPSTINSYSMLDIYVGSVLFAQYRLDQLILSQAQNSLLDNNGNLTPPDANAGLGDDNNRWGELFLTGNTLHVGPNGGMAGNDELAISYDDATDKADFTVAGTSSLTIEDTLIKAPSDFYVGDGGFAYAGSGTERKIFFDKSKGAFRAGTVNNTQWNDANVGPYSTALGTNTIASGGYSTAIGYNATASQNYSTAMGINTLANASASTALGRGTQASGDNSTAMGYFNIASGTTSTAMGESSEASGTNAVAIGTANKAVGNYSTAFGDNTIANGNYSTVMGQHVVADEDNSVAMGYYNDGSITGELLVVGNGTSTTSSNAFEVYKNGDVVVPALGNGTSSQNLQVDANGKLVTSVTANVYISSTAPSPAVDGMLWYDTGSSTLKIRVSGSWVTI